MVVLMAAVVAGENGLARLDDGDNEGRNAGLIGGFEVGVSET
jgi:hypothetical protein